MGYCFAKNPYIVQGKGCLELLRTPRDFNFKALKS